MEEAETTIQENESDLQPDDPASSSLLPWFGLILVILLSGFIGFVIGRTTADKEIVELSASGQEAATRVSERSQEEDVSDASPVVPTPAGIAEERITAIGDPGAPVTIVEFSDYQCPFCLRNFQQTWPQLKSEYIDTGRVYYVFKDFPIASLHPVAQRVHEAAQCAGDIGGQESYWEMHEIYFTNQQQWADQPQPELDNILVSLTDQADIASDEMRSCLESGRFTSVVQEDIAEGRSLGVTGTPTFFVNGYPIVGAQSFQVFQTAISMAEEGRLADAFTQQTGPNDGKAMATATALAAQPVDVAVNDSPARGRADAPVTIVEYSDFQCPYCLRHFDTTLPALQTYIESGQLRYVFKDFPIQSLHPQAPKAHESARCARELGGEEGFWEMHDLLFENQEQWAGNGESVTVFKSLAAEIGLDVDEFDQCLDSGRYKGAVDADLAEGQGFAVTGTPTFFINGQRLVGAQPLAVFQQIIESQLAELGTSSG